MSSLRAWILAFVLAAGSNSAARAQSPTPPEAFLDAELTSVTFVDVDNGWAVGDRGVIWHTIDGGRHWQRQESPTRARLESVWFADAETGWAVGGSHHPYTHHGIGVILKTVDGGAKWENVPGTNLPALKKVKFFGQRQGIAIGESSPLYPGGVFLTGDAGRTWSTVTMSSDPFPVGQASSPATEVRQAGTSTPRDSSGNWQCGDFAGLQGGFVASSSGMLGGIEGIELRTSLQSITAGRQPHALRITKAGPILVCGQRGLLVASSDGRKAFETPVHWPSEIARSFDLAAIASHGPNLWIVGNPGSVVFQSPDAGKTWETHRTACNTPLNGLVFLDENRGWAVGALGTILHTRDGGKTWRAQQQGGSRAALLAVFSEACRVPHELIVQQAGNEGYLTAVQILTTRDVGGSTPERTREAMSQLLTTHTDIATQFAIPRLKVDAGVEHLLKLWDDQDGSVPLEQFEELLVRRIRTWRPDLIVTEDAHPGGDNPLAHLTNQLVLAAVEKAADANAYRYHKEQAGLAEWRAKKVFSATTGEKQGDIKLVCSQLAPRLGASLADVADEARGQLDETYRVPSAARGFNLLVDHLPQGQGRRDFFSGLALTPGGDARRSLSNPPVPDFALLTRQIQKRQMLQGLLERSEKDPLRGQAWLAQVNEMTKGLPATASVRVMYHLGQRYQASGENELAAEVMTTLVEKHADHPLADAALLWLLHYYASAEVNHSLRGHSRFSASGSPEKSSVQPATAVLPGGDRVALAKGASAEPLGPDNRIERAIAFGKLLEKNRPMLAADPSVRFTLLNARGKGASATQERDKMLQSLATAKAGGDWMLCAKAELFIANKQHVCPKPNFVCRLATGKPKLDGRLDDDLWPNARALTLREGVEGTPLDTMIALAYDDEFLYLAISCQRSSEFVYEADDRVRQRDADLEKHDRVELLLDIDRDYATYFRLAVDHRGWTSESCLGDSSWNPTWYVAAAGDESHWTSEIAIPLAELTADKSLKKSYWAIGLQRVVPGASLQSWTPDADLDIRPEAFGLMKFE